MNPAELQNLCDDLQAALTELHFSRGAELLTGHEQDHFFAGRAKIGKLHARLMRELVQANADETRFIEYERREKPVYANGSWPGVR